MGVVPNPNNNPLCGRYVKVNGPNGTSVRVKIVDTCPGCASGDLDLSPAAFTKLADLGVGRININWNWD
ncbi:RlpA-like double-psi beta-barrel-protein domain-containing protein-containing protein [Phycomyces blakesleeanus]